MALGLHPAEDDVDLTEVDLGFLAGRVVLGDEHVLDAAAGLQIDRSATDPHIVPHRRIRQAGRCVLFNQPGQDPRRGMALFARCVQIRTQHPVDHRLERIQLRRPPHRLLPCRRHSRRQSLPHGPPVHTMASRQCTDREFLDPGIPTNRSEQLHPRSHPGHQQPSCVSHDTKARVGPDQTATTTPARRKWGQIRPPPCATPTCHSQDAASGRTQRRRNGPTGTPTSGPPARGLPLRRSRITRPRAPYDRPSYPTTCPRPPAGTRALGRCAGAASRDMPSVKRRRP